MMVHSMINKKKFFFKKTILPQKEICISFSLQKNTRLMNILSIITTKG